MAMPLFANRKPRVQWKDGTIFVESECEGVNGEITSVTIAYTRHAARSLQVSLLVSDRVEEDNIYSFDPPKKPRTAKA